MAVSMSLWEAIHGVKTSGEAQGNIAQNRPDRRYFVLTFHSFQHCIITDWSNLNFPLLLIT